MTTIPKIDKLIRLYLAQEGDHATDTPQIDMTEWLERWPAGEFSYYILYLAPEAELPAPMLTTLDEDGILTWIVTQSETQTAGIGFAEVRVIAQDGRLKKSRVIPVSVEESLTGTEGDIPESFENWFNQVLANAAVVAEAGEAAEHAEAAADFIDGMTAAATTLPTGSSATAELDRVNDVLTIGIPTGPVGPTGPVASIQSQATAYQNSSSGSVVPTGEWLDTQPVTPQGQYLWVRTTLTWSSGSTTVIYTVSRMGMDALGSVLSVCYFSPDSQGNVDIPIITTAQLQDICV